MAGGRTLSPAYAKRIAAAIAKGKSRQQARGHKPREHVERAEREREKRGLSGQEDRTIRHFVNHTFDPDGYKNADPERFVEFFAEKGFDAFKNYRAVWWKARRDYLRRLRRNPGLGGGKGRRAAREAATGGGGGGSGGGGSGGGSGGGGGGGSGHSGGGAGGYADYDDGYDYLEDLTDDAEVDDASWLYYH